MVQGKWIENHQIIQYPCGEYSEYGNSTLKDVTVLGIFLEHARIRRASIGARCKSKDLEVEWRLDKEGFSNLGTITRHKITSGEEINWGGLFIIAQNPGSAFVLGIHKNFFEPALGLSGKAFTGSWAELDCFAAHSGVAKEVTEVLKDSVILFLWNTAITSVASMLYMVKTEGFTNVFDKSSSHSAASADRSAGKTSSCCHNSVLLCPPPQLQQQPVL